MKSSRLEVRLDPVLKARVVGEAGRRGQKVATFVERALEKALDTESVAAMVPAARVRGPVEFESPAPSRASDTPLECVTAALEAEQLVQLASRPQRIPCAPVVRASSLSKDGVKPIPKKGDK